MSCVQWSILFGICALTVFLSSFQSCEAIHCYRCVGRIRDCQKWNKMVNCGNLPYCRLSALAGVDPSFGDASDIVHQDCGQPKDCPDGADPSPFMPAGALINQSYPVGSSLMFYEALIPDASDNDTRLEIFEIFNNRNLTIMCCSEDNCNCVGDQCFVGLIGSGHHTDFSIILLELATIVASILLFGNIGFI